MKIANLLLSLLIISSLCINSIKAEENCLGNSTESKVLNQTLTPLEILIQDLNDVQQLIIDGDNETAIVILKSAKKQVRKVKEISKKARKITSKRIKKGIKLLKKNKNDKALDLLQTAFDALQEAGLG